MKVSELSRRSGVSLATIKFYIREGLLPAGRATAPNQADYDAQHVERLALIRALKEDAGLSIAAIGRALRSADSAAGEFIIAGLDAIERLAGPAVNERSGEFREVLALLAGFARERGWRVDGADRSLRDAARAAVLARRALSDLSDKSPEGLGVYFEAVERLAQHEIPDEWRPEQAREQALRYAMLGTVLFEPFILALRRAAHVARARALAAQDEPSGAAACKVPAPEGSAPRTAAHTSAPRARRRTRNTP